MSKTMFSRIRNAGASRILGGLVTLGLVAFAGQASFSSSSPSYVVHSGDTLWAIAASHHLTVAQLAAANGLNPSGLLLIGTRLTIPSSSSSVAAAAPAASSSSSSSSSSANFCASFSPSYGPSGVLPATLAANPGRLALRPIFVADAERYGVSPALAEAVAWQESGWQEGAVSSDQAVGVGQLLPSTAQFVSQDLIGTNLNIGAAADNILMETRYLAYLQGHLGSTCATVAGYYEGLVNMDRYGVLPVSEPYVASVESLIPQFD